MEKSDKIFWGIVAMSGFSIVASGSLNFGTKVKMRSRASLPHSRLPSIKQHQRKGWGAWRREEDADAAG